MFSFRRRPVASVGYPPGHIDERTEMNLSSGQENSQEYEVVRRTNRTYRAVCAGETPAEKKSEVAGEIGADDG